MNKKLPTWHNRRTGDAALGKRLDRYLIHEDLLISLTNYRQWVGTKGISDHSPIYLEVASSFKKPRASFKFNSTWLKDPEYLKLVLEFWKAHPLPNVQRKGEGFYSNLIKLKQLSIDWARRKNAKEEHTLGDIENQLATLTDEQGRGYTSITAKLHLVNLETQRLKILLDREETWRLRSKAIWLQAGDGNTKFFHKFANGRKSSNII